MKDARQKAQEMTWHWRRNHESCVGQLTDRAIEGLNFAIEQALQEAAKVEWPTQKEIDDQAAMTAVFHESLPDKSIPAHTLIAFKLGVAYIKSRLKNVEE